MFGCVGVLDSGIGGLTVLRQLQKVAPQCNFVYIADHAFCPYGTKSLSEICNRVVQASRFLAQNGATSIVLACNTASVFAANVRRAVGVPVFDVVAPTCAQAVRETVNRQVALLATNATVKSCAYSKILRQYGISVLSFPCSVFVPLVENNAPQDVRLKVVQNSLQNLSKTNADTLILGCTHFPYLQREISCCAPQMKIVSCHLSIAKYFAQSRLPKGQGRTLYFTTGNAEALATLPLLQRFVHIDI